MAEGDAVAFADLCAGLGGPPARGGTVYIVGGGPGDPSYLSLRAAALLATCDVVAHDHLSPAEALDLVPAHADRILVGRRLGAPGLERDELDALLLARAAAGDAVVRLKGGDPFVFGRGGEEAAACVSAGQDFEIVPGVSSPVAVPGAAGIPVTHRGISGGFAVVTGHEADERDRSEEHAALAAFPGTLVLLMGLTRLRSLAAALVAHGRAPSTPAAVVSSGTLAGQQSVRGTLATISELVEAEGIGTPAVIVIDEVVGALTALALTGLGPVRSALAAVVVIALVEGDTWWWRHRIGGPPATSSAHSAWLPSSPSC
jgi:uroporphyrin-III C-methyltransferase